MSEESIVTDYIPPEPIAIEPVAAPLTPGQILRATREAQGLSVDDVTDVLRFSRRQVDALERDDYQSLPGATLVRGFVRSYAKLLKISPEPLLAAINPAAAVSPVDVRPPTNIGVADAGPSARLPMQPLVLLLAAVLLIAAGASAYLFFKQADATAGAAEPMIAASGVSTPVVPRTDDAVKTESTVSDGAVMPPSAALVFEFDGLSWVEVRDATQKIVLVGEYPKGSRQIVEGTAPFQVWIGKTSAVRLMYGERSIDLKPHTREDVARLVVE